MKLLLNEYEVRVMTGQSLNLMATLEPELTREALVYKNKDALIEVNKRVIEMVKNMAKIQHNTKIKINQDENFQVMPQ